MRGRRGGISESNAVEAYLGSIGIFALSFLFALQLFIDRFSGWSLLAIAFVLVFAVWIFWLFVFYINSLLIKVLRVSGLFRGTADRRVQDVFIGIVVAVMAYRLSILPGWPGWIGLLVLSTLGVNFVAAILLRLIPNAR